jgi:hypothetical protein
MMEGIVAKRKFSYDLATKRLELLQRLVLLVERESRQTVELYKMVIR